MDAATIVQQADAEGVQLVRFLYCDNGGVIRGKTTQRAGLLDRIEAGIGLTVAMQAMNSLDHLQAVDGMGPVGEIRLVPDPSTFVVLPYAPGSAALLVDLIQLDRQPWPACPRSFLKRQIARAAEQGLYFQVAFEPEWSLARVENGAFVPLDQSLCFSSIGMMTASAVIDQIVDHLLVQGLQVEQYYPELGHGQQELSIRHSDALRAADNHLLYRETVRNVAWAHGLLASFAPKPWPDQAGNGCHIHISAWDQPGGAGMGATNRFHDANDRWGLSPLGYHFIGGVLEHLPGLVALTAGSYNSYRRLQPQSWASAYTCFGPDNREGAIRIASTYWGQETVGTNLELKPADNTGNPYLALGGLLAAGLDGIRRQLDPRPGRLVEVDPASLSEEERTARGIRRLPSDQYSALEKLAEDTVLTEALGDLLTRSYLAVRRSESLAYSAEDEIFEQKGHFHKY